MKKVSRFIKGEITGWTPLEILWLAIATGVIVAVSIIQKCGAIDIIASLTGVWCVILTGKGKISAFIFGTVNVLLYAYLSYVAKFYGEVMLNLIYYFPTDFIAIVTWARHMNKSTTEVKKQRMNGKQSTVMYALTAVGIAGYGLVLKRLGGNLPYVDSASTVLSIVAQILCICRMAEQWIMWIIIDAVTIVMWSIDYMNGGESLATLFMWIVYLVNAVIMLIRWEKEAKKGSVE